MSPWVPYDEQLKRAKAELKSLMAKHAAGKAERRAEREANGLSPRYWEIDASLNEIWADVTIVDHKIFRLQRSHA